MNFKNHLQNNRTNYYTSILFVKVAAYGIILSLGVVSNLLVLAIYWQKRKAHSVTQYFFSNLAVADLLVCLLCMPVAIILTFTGNDWIFGEALCRLIPFVQMLSIAASAFSVLTITFERLYAVAYPLTFGKLFTAKKRKIMIAMTWFLSGVYAIPKLAFSSVRSVNGHYTCQANWTSEADSAYIAFGGVILHALPVVIASLTYFYMVRKSNSSIHNEQKICVNMKLHRKAMRIAVAVVIVQVISWLPFYIVSLTYSSIIFPPRNADETEDKLFFVARLFGFANSCWNPLIYAMNSSNFRLKFFHIFR